MNPLRFAFPILAAALLLPLCSPRPALAQGTLDHLLCHRMVDKTKIETAVDLFAELQPEFDAQGCKLVKPLEFCVPVTKKNVVPPPALPDLSGQALKDDYICYLLKCPDRPTVPDRFVADQFGRRLQRRYKPTKVCVPARKASPPCATLSGVGPRACGGTCPDPATECRYDRVAKMCTCEPVQLCEGKPDASGTCGGPCPPGLSCNPELNAANKRECRCSPPHDPPCGLNPSAGSCGGSCPNPTDQCVLTATGTSCTCQPFEPGCAPSTGALQCQGPCTDAAFTCKLDLLTNQCRCLPPDQNCGHNPATGQCGGACPTSTQVCRFVVAGGTTSCQCVTP